MLGAVRVSVSAARQRITFLRATGSSLDELSVDDHMAFIAPGQTGRSPRHCTAKRRNAQCSDIRNAVTPMPAARGPRCQCSRAQHERLSAGNTTLPTHAMRCRIGPGGATLVAPVHVPRASDVAGP